MTRKPGKKAKSTNNTHPIEVTNQIFDTLLILQRGPTGLQPGLHPDFLEVKRKGLPIKFTYWFGRLVEKLNKHLQSYLEARNALLEKYGEKWDKDGDKHKKGDLKRNPDQTVVILEDRKAEYEKESRELANIELSFDNMHQIPFPMKKIEEMEDKDGKPLFTPDQMTMILPFIYLEDENT